jgi:hypothetical protein
MHELIVMVCSGHPHISPYIHALRVEARGGLIINQNQKIKLKGLEPKKSVPYLVPDIKKPK